jgi:hypothetical protein
MEDIMALYNRSPSIFDDSLLEDALLESERDSFKETPPPPSGPLAQRQDVRQRLRAAELLLKTSRIIEKIKPLSENQRQLVIQMRQQAVQIMAARPVHPVQTPAVPTTESPNSPSVRTK